MAEHNNLKSLFSDIADAIREKNGSTDTIVADNFPSVIAAIDTQEDLDPELADQDAKIAELQELLQGKALPSGEDLTEELAAQSEIIAEQDELITQLASALEGKVGAESVEIETATATITIGATLGAQIISATVFENKEVSSFVKKNIGTNYTTLTIDKIIIGSLIHVKFSVSGAVPSATLSGLEAVYFGENYYVYKVTGKDVNMEFYIGQ